MEKELIQQGAEAKVYRITWDASYAILKERFSKSWRHEILDKKLRKQRMKQETNCLIKAKENGLLVPTVYKTDKKACCIVMEWIEGFTLHRALINEIWDRKSRKEKFMQLGAILAKLHEIGIIHGDLTTSNILVKQITQELILIDFGLSYVSISEEDKAVDLYVLERAFTSTHPTLQPEFKLVVEAYMRHCERPNEMSKKLENVRARGRKRTMLG